MGPFWSPDGRAIGFSVDDQIRRVDVNGGAVVTLGGGFLGLPRGTVRALCSSTAGSTGGGMRLISAHGRTRDGDRGHAPRRVS